MKKEKCAHQIWTKEYPFELLGYSEESDLAWMFCNECEQNFWIQFKMPI